MGGKVRCDGGVCGICQVVKKKPYTRRNCLRAVCFVAYSWVNDLQSFKHLVTDV